MIYGPRVCRFEDFAASLPRICRKTYLGSFGARICRNITGVRSVDLQDVDLQDDALHFAAKQPRFVA